MNHHTRFFLLTRLTACIALILLSSFATNAQSEVILNLSDFGPVGNGVADDGPAFQKAFDALHAAGGGKLLIPAGSYRILTPVEKDFASIPGAKVTIQGVPSSKMPAPVTASGNQLAEGLALASDIIPATGVDKITFTIRNVDTFLIEHVGFSGTPDSETDAFITLNFINIGKATIRHCEFYGVSTFGFRADLGGGNIVRATRSELSIELTVFLGCTGNSGVYAALVENIEWKKFSISNSIFLDYGLREFFSKTGLGAPLSWVNLGNAAAPTPDSLRREVIVRDVFLDEGGWVGISALPYRYIPFNTVPDLFYISGLKMNVSNLGTSGHLFYYGRNLLIENSHYGWSHNANSAVDINRFDNVILDKLTCIAHANRIMADDMTGRLTVINSVYDELASLAKTTTVLETAPENDPVQYVRSQFVNALGRQPDPAAHFYWSDLLIKCGDNNDCLNEKRSALSEYLGNHPQENFVLAGTVTDESGAAMSDATVSLTGSQSLKMVTGAQGKFRFSGLPTSGIYTVTVNKPHFQFASANKTFVHPATDLSVSFVGGKRTRFEVAGSVIDENGNPISGAVASLTGTQSGSATTDSAGSFRFQDLPLDGSYTVTINKQHYTFVTSTKSFSQPNDDVAIVFNARLNRHSITGRLTRLDGAGMSGVVLQLAQSPSSTATTDANGFYTFTQLAAGGNYTVVPALNRFAFAPANTTFNDLGANVAANFVGKLKPELMISEGTEFAIALDSVSFTMQPFSLFNSLEFTSDEFLRLMIFATNVEPVGPSQITVVGTDDLGQAHPLEVEFMGEVPGLSWLKQLNIKVPSGTLGGKCVQLSVTVAEVTSNQGRICIATHTP